MMKKHWDKIALAVIVLLAIAIRIYHFHDWLYFAMDQGRDANLIRKAVENGISHLPLLGPRAAGTFLRLGPAFYYFQYISAKIFNSTDPAVLAYPDLFFGILSVPLFFFFLRLYFQNTISLLMAALFAFNFVAIQYSRFAWNPNSVLFWTLFCFIGILKLTDETNEKKKYLWTICSATGLAIASQLHFLALFIVSGTILVYLVWSRLIFRLGWKKIMLSIFIILLFYVPVIISDVATKGDNLKQFVWSFFNKPQEHSLVDNFFTNAISHSQHYFFILSSYASKTGTFSLWGGFALICFGLFYLWKKYSGEKNMAKKNFFRLVVVWFLVSFLVLLPFAFQILEIKSRFFFSSFFLPFIFFAFGVEWIFNSRLKKKLAMPLVFLAGATILALNVEAASTWFSGFSGNQRQSFTMERNLFVKQTAGFTLANIQELAKYLIFRTTNEKKKIYILGNMDYRVPVEYFLKREKPPIDYGKISLKCRDPEMLYFAITSVSGGCQSIPSKYFAIFEAVRAKAFGGLMVCELKLKNDLPEYEKKKKEKKDEESSSEDKKPAPKRTERVKWGDL